MLNEIKNALESVDNNVFYGGITNREPTDKWDYIVFSRGPLQRNSKGNTSYTRTINVAIVREEYVPEETIQQVIDAMEAIPNVRFADDGGDSDYERKTNTKAVVEAALLTFTWSYKKQVTS